jgi:hypothetical protein
VTGTRNAYSSRVRDLLALITVEVNDDYDSPDVQPLTRDAWDTRGEDAVLLLLTVTLLALRQLGRASGQSDSSAWQELLPEIHDLINRTESSDT